MTKKLTFHVDPGHGWLEVPKDELRRVGIDDQISDYSMQSRDGLTAYLEEDCDAPLYIRAAGLKDADVVEQYHQSDCFTRTLPRYRRPMSRAAWSGIHDALHPRPVVDYDDLDPGQRQAMAELNDQG